MRFLWIKATGNSALFVVAVGGDANNSDHHLIIQQVLKLHEILMDKSHK